MKISWKIITCKHWVSGGSTSLSSQDKHASRRRRAIEDSDDSDDKERITSGAKRLKQEKKSSDAALESRFVGRNLQSSVNRGIALLIEWFQQPGTPNQLPMKMLRMQAVKEVSQAQCFATDMRLRARTNQQQTTSGSSKKDWMDAILEVFKAAQLKSLILR